jgi:hypothetical protein
MMTEITSLNNYLQSNLVPIVTDFPSQPFILNSKAMTLFHKYQDQENNKFHKIPSIIKNFIPIIGPLHASLT